VYYFPVQEARRRTNRPSQPKIFCYLKEPPYLCGVISQSIDKKEEILRAALKLFVEYGFHATPTSKIAKEARVANGTLFHYYKTKDELIVALYVEIKTRLSACVLESSGPGENNDKETWKKYYLAALNWGISSPLEFKFVQQFMSSPYLLLLAPEEIQKQSQFTLELLKQGIKDKLIKPLPAELLNTMLTSHIYGISNYISNSKLSEKEKKKLMEQSFELIWSMIEL
jgi:AcrR family transcriptional regulator